MRSLALHQITAIEASPPELVSIAADLGCQQVCVFVVSPEVLLSEQDVPAGRFPVVTPGGKREMLERLNGTGLSVSNIEFFPLGPAVEVDAYREALELGAALGARRAVCHIHDPETQRAIANFGRLCEMAADCGMEVGLEFMGLTPACNCLQRARYFIEQTGVDNAGIAIDALHLVRTGGSVADVQQLPPRLISYAQICDGAGRQITSDYFPEALNRVIPGEGVFPLRELIAAIPDQTPLDVEVPVSDETLRQRGESEIEHARRAVSATRALLGNGG